MNRAIYLSLARMSGKEQGFIEEAFETNWVVPLGPNVNGFEQSLKGYLTQDKEVAALSSGTAAIHLALVELGVGVGDEVICQSFTFCASANPIVYQGATPVFVDSEAQTWNMSPELLEIAIKERIEKTGKTPKAIIPVHLYGMPAKMDEICAIAQKYNIPIVEDAAEALGSQYNGQKCGTFGRFGILSFNGNKMITTSGGGAAVCESEEAKSKIVFYATQARENYPYYQHEKIGYNYRMSNICAGIGRGQMTVLDEHVEHHRHLNALYREAFAEIDGVTVMSNPSYKFNSNFWLTTILIDKQITGVDYNEVMEALKEHSIESRPLWKPLHLQPIFASCPSYVNGVSEALFKQGLCLPSGPCVGEDDIKRIVAKIINRLK
ncbi:MAG: DegT/DnrJ/EryC1/StrS family aminotransferase [Rikenellaceae bacterium]